MSLIFLPVEKIRISYDSVVCIVLNIYALLGLYALIYVVHHDNMAV